MRRPPQGFTRATAPGDAIDRRLSLRFLTNLGCAASTDGGSRRRPDEEASAIDTRTSPATAATGPASVAESSGDERPWVAIGDVHGRADLLAGLLDAVERELSDPRIVLLGDLVDRGPDVAGTVRLAREVPGRFPGSKVLQGNHEDWMLSALRGEEAAREDWLTWGGEATCRSYGVDPARDRLRLADAFAAHADDLAFLRARPRRLEGFGAAAGHLFVHAGVDPHAPLDDQAARDLIWIREPFLSWPHALPMRVVHGHTIAPRPQERAHRIGVDTGAYATGVLTAAILEPGTAPRYLATHDEGGVRAIAPDRVAAPGPGAVPGRR